MDQGCPHCRWRPPVRSSPCICNLPPGFSLHQAHVPAYASRPTQTTDNHGLSRARRASHGVHHIPPSLLPGRRSRRHWPLMARSSLENRACEGMVPGTRKSRWRLEQFVPPYVTCCEQTIQQRATSCSLFAVTVRELELASSFGYRHL